MSLRSTFTPSAPEISPDAPPPYEESKSLVAKLDNIPLEIKSDVMALYHEIKAAGLENHEARVCVALDISYSMQNPNEFFYNEESKEVATGKVQRLINKAVALSLLFDDDKTVEIFPFAGTAYAPITINEKNFKESAQLVIDKVGIQSGTNYADPVKTIREHYFKDGGHRTSPQPSVQAPVFVLFITDGDPNLKKTEARQEFASASHQAIFFKFLALRGKQVDTTFSFLKDIDDPTTKSSFFIDNADLVILDQPEELTMQQLIHEYRPWAIHAYQSGLLTLDPRIKGFEAKSEGRIVSTGAGMFTPKPAPASLPPKVDTNCTCKIL